MLKLSWRTLSLILVVTVAPLDLSRAGESRTPSAVEPIKLTGRGDRATKKFNLEEGLAFWKITHNGRSNFKVHLLDEKGDEVDLPVNQIGRYDGIQAGNIRRAGSYRLQVNADGAWAIEVEQPRPDSAPEPPQAFNGKGRRVSSFFSLKEGAHVFEVTHQGKGIFRAQLLDSRGRLIDQVAGVIGSYDGSKAVKIEEPGIYIMTVAADGPWTVSVD